MAERMPPQPAADKKLCVAVITPYYKESLEYLLACRDSVANQDGADITHFFVADGFPQKEVASWDVQHVILPQSHADYGNTPRGIGSFLAIAQDVDFIAYLDADNWYYPDHIKSLIDLHLETEADVVCSFRSLHMPDGKVLAGLQQRDENLLKHVDTSCYLLHKAAFDTPDVWLKMPKKVACIGDRIFLKALQKQRLKFAFSKKMTVAYRTLWADHYRAMGLEPPPEAKVLANDYKQYLMTVGGAREFVDKLGFYPF